LGEGYIINALEIKQKFNFPDEVLTSPDVQAAALQGMITRLGKGDINYALKIKQKFNFPDADVQAAALQGMIITLGKGYIINALEIKQKFNLPDEVLTSPDVQAAALQGMITRLGKGYIDGALEIKQKFNLPDADVQAAVRHHSRNNYNQVPLEPYAEEFGLEGFIEPSRQLRLTLAEYLAINEQQLASVSAQPEERAQEVYQLLVEESAVWRDSQNIGQTFGAGAENFGYERMFNYLDRKGLSRHDGLHAFRDIVALQEKSGLTPDAFFNSILDQVHRDGAQYDEGTAHHHLNALAQSLRDVRDGEVLSRAEKFSDIMKLKDLTVQYRTPGAPYASWKALKKFHELVELLGKTEILQDLQELKHQGKDALYQYIERLAFHPNISTEKVMEFWRDPAGFLELGDSHTPEEVHNMKKPSNYVEFPNLDLSAEELRDALVEGVYDRLQVFKPLEIEYAVASKRPGDLREHIVQALGKRSEGIAGAAREPKKLFSELNKVFKARGAKLQDFLTSSEPLRDVELSAQVEQLLANQKFGLPPAGPIERFRVKINRKSDPDGVVAGNDTACCMPFGSGKNNVYTFNPICALLTVQRQTIDGGWRTLAQSVLTEDIAVGKNVAEVVEQLKGENTRLNNVIGEEVLRSQPGIVTCDNIEVSPNYQDHAVIESLYQDFLHEYLARFGARDKLDSFKVIVGQGFTDLDVEWSKVPNEFIPRAPVGYSDNLGKECYVIDYNKAKPMEVQFVERTVNLQERQVSPEVAQSLPRGVSGLSFRDAIAVAYIEGKAYSSNESLMEYLHNMENALIAKDVNNTAKGRPNISFKYQDEQGVIHGYILAYEGRVHKEGEEVVYVSDLASDGNARAGGSLILAFTQEYKRNYIDAGKLFPIYAQMREQTSFAIVQKQLEKLGKGTGVEFEFEELGTYEVGGDTMHEVMIRPQRKE
ncbi:MAG: hypothetical protein HY974_01065, partial [Candidatus Kerfeldbacteria bacterium]|nr:hypothetical protein [Candidatus Kerfeldbacteria bacterium]